MLEYLDFPVFHEMERFMLKKEMYLKKEQGNLSFIPQEVQA